MERVSSIGALRVLAKVDQTIYNLLSSDLGRRAVSEALADKGFSVSEKLIRTWRNEKKNINDMAQYIHVSFSSPTIKPREPFNYGDGAAMQSSKPKSQKARTIVVMPDVQAPLHDRHLVYKFTQFLKDYAPDELAQVGDFTDSTEISRWVRGKKTEFAGDLQAGFDAASNILGDIREVFDGRFRIVRSNHDDRLELYIESCAPGLASLSALSIENLAGFNEHDVEFVRDEVVELAPGWVMSHGDEGSLSPVAGKTAFGLAKNKFGTNTICGHTHRAGMTSESTGYNGRIRRTLTGLEVGHFMDLTQADYLKKKGVAMNWQQAFGILEIYGDKVFPRLITVEDGMFAVDGQLY